MFEPAIAQGDGLAPTELGQPSARAVPTDIPLGCGNGLAVANQDQSGGCRRCSVAAHDTFTGGRFSTEFQKASSGIDNMRSYTAGG